MINVERHKQFYPYVFAARLLIYIMRIPLLLAYFKYPQISRCYIYMQGLQVFINSFDAYAGDQMCDYNQALSLAYIGIALSVDFIPNLIYLNVIALLVCFVSHPLIYEQELNMIHLVVKVVSVICIDIFYIYYIVAFSYIIRIYHRVGG